MRRRPRRAVRNVRAAFAPFLDAPEPVPLATVIESVLGQVAERDDGGDTDTGRIAIQAWGEALRDGTVAAVVADRYREVREDLTEITRRAQSAGYVDADADPAAIAEVVYALFPGFIVERLVVGDVDPRSWGGALRAVGVR